LQRWWDDTDKIRFFIEHLIKVKEAREVAGSKKGEIRLGSGKKKKPIEERLIDGKKNHEPITVLEFAQKPSFFNIQLPEPHEFLTAPQHDLILQEVDEKVAVDFYKEIQDWLNERKVAHLIPKFEIENYVMNVVRWVQAEKEVAKFGMYRTHESGKWAVINEYEKNRKLLSKAVTTSWYQIYLVIRENSVAKYEGRSPHEDYLASALDW
jgi:hypothetical protein